MQAVTVQVFGMCYTSAASRTARVRDVRRLLQRTCDYEARAAMKSKLGTLEEVGYRTSADEWWSARMCVTERRECRMSTRPLLDAARLL